MIVSSFSNLTTLQPGLYPRLYCISNPRFRSLSHRDNFKMFARPLLCILLPLFARLAVAQSIQFDGRVASNTKVADFDGGKIFDPKQVFGAGLSLSQLLVLPAIGPSLFDNGSVPVEVTIRYVNLAHSTKKLVCTRPVDTSYFLSDESIFNGQTGFRRAEVVPASNDGTDASTEGVKTVHFSIMKDVQKPLNLSHEYQLFFLESRFVLKPIISQSSYVCLYIPHAHVLPTLGDIPLSIQWVVLWPRWHATSK